VFDYGLSLAKINKKVMSQLSEDPTNTESDCYNKTAAANAEILAMSDLQVLILEGLDSDQILHRLSIMQYKLKEEMDACLT
jgi:hypothetical protein